MFLFDEGNPKRLCERQFVDFLAARTIQSGLDKLYKDPKYLYGKVLGSENEGEDLVEGGNRLGVLKRKILLRRDQKARASGEVSGF